MKTKPTQYASRELNSVGLQADVILARSVAPLDQKRKEKIATFCNILPERVISAPDVESIYDVPLNFEKDGLGNILCEVLSLKSHQTHLKEWETFVAKTKNGNKKLNIAVIGKYFMSGDYVLSDVYISVIESLKHAAASLDVGVKLSYLDSEVYEKDASKVRRTAPV
jgi:CTP synthase